MLNLCLCRSKHCSSLNCIITFANWGDGDYLICNICSISSVIGLCIYSSIYIFIHLFLHLLNVCINFLNNFCMSLSKRNKNCFCCFISNSLSIFWLYILIIHILDVYMILRLITRYQQTLSCIFILLSTWISDYSNL